MRKQHRVPLSNGQVLLVEEGAESLHLALEDTGHPGEVAYYVAAVDRSGVTVMCNAGDANVTLTDGLKEPPDDEPFEAEVSRCLAELATGNDAAYGGREIEDGEMGFTYNGSDFYGTLREAMWAIDREPGDTDG